MQQAQRFPIRNPHCAQTQNPRRDIPFERLLLPDAPMIPYRSRKHDPKTVLGWGQRKLLMSEIEFICRYAPQDGRPCVVIYAGAAPGTHTAFLSDMFPGVRFVLVDPSEFTVVADGDRIITRNAMFTDELAMELKREYADWFILFVSDVRSSDHSLVSREEHEMRISADMDAQARWHGIIAPFRSMLKFCLPYAEGTTRYLRGDIHLPIWGPITTTECRLIVDAAAEECVYDHTEHEQRMYAFNTVTRPALYPHGVRGVGIDHCYDCRAEVETLRLYLGVDSTDRDIANLSASISRAVGGRRTLAHGNVDPAERKRVIRERQWRNGRPAYEQDE